jgi:hypothetical protein
MGAVAKGCAATAAPPSSAQPAAASISSAPAVASVSHQPPPLGENAPLPFGRTADRPPAGHPCATSANASACIWRRAAPPRCCE